ncbi:molybdopterin-dependent oxidoreductase [Candidatus Aerophobetes bacterium]|nr:molybdopterin-dependent oxidoreductase [Candidatus Aerophobetes bacterium]
MKKKSLIFILSLLSLFIISRRVISSEWTLKLVFGETQAEFSLSELEEFPVREAEHRGAIYKGVLLRDLFIEAGIDIGRIESLEVFASDGYQVKYERRIAKGFNVILAYKKNGVPLSEEGEGKIRIIIPGGRSSLQIKFLEKIFVKLGKWRLTLVTKEKEKEYSLAILKKLPVREIEFNSKIYEGPSLKAFLEGEGINFNEIKSIEVIAADNYKVNYELEAVLEDKVILAYKVNGVPLSEKRGDIRCIFLEGGKETQVKRVERIIIK